MKKVTRLLCFVWMLVLSMMLCIPAFAAEEDTGFSDVAANAWYADSVKFVRDRGLMNGTSATTFSPGYPIWGGDMPKIVYHFLESYDFSGKTIVPFCTHAGSGLANTVSTIR